MTHTRSLVALPLVGLLALRAFSQEPAPENRGTHESQRPEGLLALGDPRGWDAKSFQGLGLWEEGSLRSPEVNPGSSLNDPLGSWADSPELAGALPPPGPATLAESPALYEPPILPCACGCGIFEVGNGSMLPQGQGGIIFFEWDYQSQNRNWSRHSSAPAQENGDRLLMTSFLRLGLQYMFTDQWGVEVDIPFAHRYFRQDDGSGTGTNVATDWTDWGDMRLKALYCGFFKDLSLGVDFGLKVPTGNYTHDGADRDTQLGTGSTDLLLGGFYRMALTPDRSWNAFFQAEGDFPFLIRDQYRPGLEVDASAGVDYQGLWLGTLKIVPFGQVLVAGRTSDRGAQSAHPVASGYQRVLLSPGLELMMHPFMIYGDVEFPVWQNMRGDQLVASALFKVVIAYSF